MITFPCRNESARSLIGPQICALGSFNFEDFEDLPDRAAGLAQIENEKDKIRKACSRFGRTDPNGTYYCWLHLPSESKGKEEGFRKALAERIADQNERINFRGVYFPELFGNDNFAGVLRDKDVFDRKIYFTYATFRKGVDFANAIFEDTVSFAKAEFYGNANFHKAVFRSSTKFHKSQFFERANFSNSTFEKNAEFHMSYFECDAIFREATFGKEKAPGPFNFQKVLFEKEAVFEGATFYTETRSTFLDAKFRDYANFKRIDFPSLDPAALEGDEASTPQSAITFEDAEFDSTARFSSKDPARDWKDRQIRFMQAYFKEPKKIAFRKVKLNPTSFIRTSVIDVEFTDVDWLNTKGWSLKKNFRREASLYFGGDAVFERASKEAKNTFNRFLRTSCRRLALNSEGDNRYNEASRFRRMAFELERLTQKEDWAKWKRDLAKLLSHEIKMRNIRQDLAAHSKKVGSHILDVPFDFVHSVYRALSGYGERGSQAFVGLFLIWLGFAICFSYFGTFEGEVHELGMGQASIYSLQVLTLQKPDPKPLSTATLVFYALETILAPIQLALFALAIRRKFMR
jgi:hypothetical protein